VKLACTFLSAKVFKMLQERNGNVDRKEMIAFLKEGIMILEGIKIRDDEYDHLSDEELQKEVDWIDYLFNK
jgi:hypothetical protein